MWQYSRRMIVMGQPPSSLLPFEDLFTRSDGDMGNGWSYTAGLWTVSSNAAVGTPGLSVTELVTNGSFDSDTTGWTPANSATLASIAGGVSGNCLEQTNGGASDGRANQTITTQNHKWYQASVYHKNVEAGQGYLRIGSYVTWSGLNDANWASKVTTIRSTGTSFVFGLGSNTGSLGAKTLWDSASCKEITLVDMLCTRDLESTGVDVSVPLTITTYQREGIVICLDSASSPANFILALHDGTNAMLLKCVGGTYTSLISAAAAYGSSKVLRVKKSGTTVQLFYDGAQVGTDQTVSDAGIVGNTRHGLFSTSGAGSFASFTAVAA